MSKQTALEIVDNARIHAAYTNSGGASRATEWLLFNARSIIKAEQSGDVLHILCLAANRRQFIRSIGGGQ
jgi:hypothetical protein